MLEAITGLLTSLSVLVAFGSLFWIKRTTGAINTIYGINSVIIIAFSIWGYYDCLMIPHVAFHQLFLGIFISAMSVTNVIAASNKNEKLVDRRKNHRRGENVTTLPLQERRVVERRKSATMKQTKLRLGS